MSKHEWQISIENTSFVQRDTRGATESQRNGLNKRLIKDVSVVIKNLPVHEVFHAAAQPLREVCRNIVFHLWYAALKFPQVALHGACFHLTRRGRGKNPLRGFGHPARTAAAALALVRRQHLPSQKPFTFYLKSTWDESLSPIRLCLPLYLSHSLAPLSLRPPLLPVSFFPRIVLVTFPRFFLPLVSIESRGLEFPIIA